MDKRVFIEFCADKESALATVTFWTTKRKFRLVGMTDFADSVSLIRGEFKDGKYKQGDGEYLHYPSDQDVLVLLFEELEEAKA